MGALAAATATQPRKVGRYLLFDEIAAGGMATVHLARLMGPIGFARTVAVKQMHRHLASDEHARAMFIDEARMAARVRHPNVVAVMDVVVDERDLFLVMDYVHGESLSRLATAQPPDSRAVPVAIASAIVIGALHGLHAAHEAKDEKGQPLGLVHRDVSPQNILVGIDGVPRVVDFGIAKAAGRLQNTTDGQLKGKAGYITPEQLLGEVTDRRADVYSASVVLWELLAGRRLFDGDGTASTLRQVLAPEYDPPSHFTPSVDAAVDEVVLKGLAWKPEARFATAWEMAAALEKVAPPASVRQISEWVERVAGERLQTRANRVADIESASLSGGSSPVVEMRRRGASQDDIATMIPIVAEPTTPDAAHAAAPRSEPSARLAREKRVAAAGVGLVAVGIGTFLFVGGRSHEPPLADHTPAAASVPAPDRVVAPEPSVSVVLAAATSVTSAAQDPPARPSAAAKPNALRRVPGPATSPNCAVRFTWAPDGTKVPKPGCM